MDNNEKNNISTDDFEIIDIPNTSEIDSGNQFDNNQMNIPLEQVNLDNNFNYSNVEPESIFNVEPSNIEQQDSYNELGNISQQQLDSINQYQQIDEGNNELSTSYNEIGDINNEPNLEDVNLNSDVTEKRNDYVTNNNSETSNKKLDQSVKEIIIMGVIVAVVIILLPILYNVSNGKYHVTANIKNAVSSIFSKKSEETKSTKKDKVNEVEDTVIDDEQEKEETDITFDFSVYNNQIIDNSSLKLLLDDYKNNIILLSPTTENGIQTYKIQIAKDVKSAEYSISNPEQAFEEFSTQYLQAESNYLITVVNENDNISSITAIRQ